MLVFGATCSVCGWWERSEFGEFSPDCQSDELISTPMLPNHSRRRVILVHSDGLNGHNGKCVGFLFSLLATVHVKLRHQDDSRRLGIRPWCGKIENDPRPLEPTTAMSSFLPSLRRSSCAPLDDAPLAALPASESTALSKLEALVSKELFSSSSAVLHHNDPWLHLPATNRRALSLRFLRFHCLSVDAALAQMLRVAAWRRDDRPWERPVKAMVGPAAGIPALRVGATGSDGEALLYSPAKFYIKQEIDHAKQDVAIKTFFEQLLYAEGGPRCRAGVIVLDFQDMHMRNVDLLATKNGIRIFTDYYPEIFKKILVVNYAKWLYGSKLRFVTNDAFGFGKIR